MRSILFLGLLIAIVGCGDSEPVQPKPRDVAGDKGTTVKGKITLNGVPLGQGIILFGNDEGKMGYANIAMNGVFFGMKIPSGSVKAGVIIKPDPKMIMALEGKSGSKGKGGPTPPMNMGGSKMGGPPGMGGPKIGGPPGMPGMPPGMPQQMIDQMKAKGANIPGLEIPKELDEKMIAAIEKKYSNLDKSGLRFTISDGFNELPTINLEIPETPK